jgi:hypothetical protein
VTRVKVTVSSGIGSPPSVRTFVSTLKESLKVGTVSAPKTDVFCMRHRSGRLEPTVDYTVVYRLEFPRSKSSRSVEPPISTSPLRPACSVLEPPPPIRMLRPAPPCSTSLPVLPIRIAGQVVLCKPVIFVDDPPVHGVLAGVQCLKGPEFIRAATLTGFEFREWLQPSLA